MTDLSAHKRLVSIGECMIEMSGGSGGQYRLGYAGDTLNTAYYARAGLSEEWQVDYFTALGDDPYSEKMRAFLEEQGIGTAHVRAIPGKRPGLYLIHQADGDRHFTYWRETSAARRLADDRAELASALGDAGLIYFSGITLAILDIEARQRLLSALATARRGGARVAFDPNIRPSLWPDNAAIAAGIEAAGAVTDIALPTFDDDRAVFGDADPGATVERYRGYGVGEVVVKNGPGEATIATGDTVTRVAAEAVDEVVDATGAGDSFGGAYLAQRLGGASAETAGRTAHRTAARVIGHAGALVPRSALDAG